MDPPPSHYMPGTKGPWRPMGSLSMCLGGQLQPSSAHSIDPSGEATLWNSFAREFAEEVLGMSDADSRQGSPINMSAEPFSSLSLMRDNGHLKVFLLGLVLDPLSFWPSLLAVAVLNRNEAVRTLPAFVNSNTEGVVIAKDKALSGFEFDSERVKQLNGDPTVGVAAKGCLELAWRHRNLL